MSLRFPGVLVLPTSSNRKLSPVDLVKTPELTRARPVPRAPFAASTYVSIRKTCDDVCKFKDAGCFADTGFTGKMVHRLDDEAKNESRNLGLIEADAIDKKLFPDGVPQDGGKYATSGRDLRLHVSGDAEDEVAALLLSMAALRYQKRGGGAVWTYTHSWRRIERRVWDPIQVLASVENVKDAEMAYLHDYVPALVVREFPSTKAFALPKTDLKFIPCPAETTKTTCVQCRLCFDTKRLHEKKLGIAFAVHGMGMKKAKRKLPLYNTLFGTLD